jgi:hypothetical protein
MVHPMVCRLLLVVFMARRKPHDNPSVPDEHLPTDKYFTGDGRKLKELSRVGAMAPDADPEVQTQPREPKRRGRR